MKPVWHNFAHCKPKQGQLIVIAQDHSDGLYTYNVRYYRRSILKRFYRGNAAYWWMTIPEAPIQKLSVNDAMRTS